MHEDEWTLFNVQKKGNDVHLRKVTEEEVSSDQLLNLPASAQKQVDQVNKSINNQKDNLLNLYVILSDDLIDAKKFRLREDEEDE